MERKSFLEALFDFSFTEFIAVRAAGFLYGLGILCAAIATLGWLVCGFSRGFWLGLLYLIVSPIVLFFHILVARLAVEVLVALVRTAQNTGVFTAERDIELPDRD